DTARGLQAPQGAGARRTHRARPGSAMAPLPAPGRAAQGRRRVDRALSPPLGGELRPSGQLSSGAAAEREEVQSKDHKEGGREWPKKLTPKHGRPSASL